jgi:tryptophan halogenase
MSTDSQQIRKLLIVGGGTSGWMAASYLSRALQNVEVTVVESERIGTIGVGEATFSTVKLFFDFLGLRERDWMPHCSAAYKMAIRFVDWTQAKGHFYHPFQRLETAAGVGADRWWLKLKRGQQPFDYACFGVPHLCDAMRSPRYLDGTVFDDRVHEFFDEAAAPPNSMMSRHSVQYPYGYHFNAAELARFLQGQATARGVKRIVDDVVDVQLGPDGAIAAVRTKGHGALTADLYIDCTGFRGLLLNQALSEPFISFNDTLLNDRAVAIQVPRDCERDGIRPYTTAQAHDAGWSWNIPLYGRDGTGYVYSSKFIDKEEAEREFRAFLGPAADGCAANHIQMRIGRSRNSWVKNCVAIGLSSGFVEPLESTGIFFIQHGIEELVEHFPKSNVFDDRLVASYNRSIAECIDGVREFLTIHYCASDRVDTPFWRATKQIAVPESLRERLALWKSQLPGPRTIYSKYHGFEAYSWSVMLLGVGHRPQSYPAILDHLDDSEARAMFDRIRARAKHLMETLPSQYEYLTQLRQQAMIPEESAGTAMQPGDQVAQALRGVGAIQEALGRNDEVLLGHAYFALCEDGAIDRASLLEVIKQMYCFSVFFERILTRRMAMYCTDMDPRIGDIARSHLRDEIGHAALFRECLLENGISRQEMDQVAPKMFTKAMFGYLLATVDHENEYVTNVAIMQVMETIGYHVFRATLGVLRAHGMLARAFVDHADADEDHRHLGLELADSFDEGTMRACLRTVDDLYRLMGFMLTEFLADAPFVTSGASSEMTVRVSRVTALRPPPGEDAADDEPLEPATAVGS